MNKLEEIFFILMRSAIWDTTPILPRKMSDEEWKEIYAISKILNVAMEELFE